jgi:WD40 repeat protein
MAFSADAARLFTLTEDGTLTGWVIASRQPFRTAKFPGSDFSLDPRWLVFSPDGGAVAFRAENGLGLWELESGKQTRVRFTGTQSSPTVLSFSPDGKLLAAGVGDSDSEVYVWAVQNLWGSASTVPPPRGRFGKHRDWICDVAFAPDNSALVSASADSTLCVWQMDGPEVCRRYRGHRHQVLAVAWSPDGQRLVSSGEDGTVRVWDPCREPATSAPTVFPAPVYRYNFRLSGDGKSALILEPTNRMAVLWDAVKLQPLEPLAFAGTNLSRVAWSADGRKLATGDELGDVRIWDLVSRQAILNVAVQGYNVRYLEFSPNGQILLCGALRPGPWDRITKLWDLSEGREIALPREAMTDATWADFSPDCRLLAVLHFGGALDLWEIRSGRCRVRLTQPLAGLKEEGYVAFSPDGRTWASSTQRGVLALWDAAGKQPRTIIPRTTQELWDLSFSADGTRLLVSGKRASDAVRLLDVTSKRFVATLSGKADVYWFSRMTADNSTVYAVGEKTVLLWRAPSWAEIEAAEKGRRTP